MTNSTKRVASPLLPVRAFQSLLRLDPRTGAISGSESRPNSPFSLNMIKLNGEPREIFVEWRWSIVKEGEFEDKLTTLSRAEYKTIFDAVSEDHILAGDIVDHWFDVMRHYNSQSSSLYSGIMTFKEKLRELIFSLRLTVQPEILSAIS
jgi:hypothetical protein